MGLSLVRCPFCDRRYNVTGLPSGTKVLCTSCRAILTVPGERFVKRESFWRRLVPRSSVAQAATAIVGGLALAAGGLFAIRSNQNDPGKAIGERSNNPPAERESHGRGGQYQWSLLTVDQQKEFHPDRFAIHTSTRMYPFVLVGEKHTEVQLSFLFKHYEDLLPKLINTFKAEFGDPLGLGPIRDRLLIVLYTRRETYDAWWRRGNGKPAPLDVSGVYSQLDKRVTIFFDTDRVLPPASPKEVLFHEAVHQIIHYYHLQRAKESRPAAWWFQEGMGNYFEGYYESGGETILRTSAATSRLPMAKEMVSGERTKFINLVQLLTWTVDDIWAFLNQGPQGAKDAMNNSHQQEVIKYAYAQSWALVHFLIHAGDGIYRPFFLEYFRSELEGRGGRDEFDRLFKLHHEGLELSELENRFIKYVQNLK